MKLWMNLEFIMKPSNIIMIIITYMYAQTNFFIKWIETETVQI